MKVINRLRDTRTKIADSRVKVCLYYYDSIYNNAYTYIKILVQLYASACLGKGGHK